jgi:CPA1 family monovalent cation:H+ antiporter
MIAEELGVSGILAAVAAGMMQSWADLLPRQTNTRLLNRSVWSMLEFAFNGVVFLLLGLQLPDILKSVAHHADDVMWRSSLLLFYVLAVYAVLLLLRFGWVWCYWKVSVRFEQWWGIELGGKAGEPVLRLSAISALGGVRGAVTLAGVLSVPLLLLDGTAFPQRDLIIFIAAGVILVSLLSATIGLPILLRGLPVRSNDQRELEVQAVWRKTAAAAIHLLESEELPASEGADAEETARLAEMKAKLMAEYRHELDPAPDSKEARERARALELADQALRIKALRAQRLELYRMRREHEIDDETMREVLGELDNQEAWVTSKAGRWV